MDAVDPLVAVRILAEEQFRPQGRPGSRKDRGAQRGHLNGIAFGTDACSFRRQPEPVNLSLRRNK